MKRLCLALAAALLAACGGGGGAGSPMNTSGPSPAPSTAADAFTAGLAALVESTPETTEPDNVEGVSPSRPDDGEPAKVK
ncbi:hypothetical protein [Pseudoduganella violaceinigra]|uniref:hypothetical protein n=1 Tax=Pseudoduganella violaceinigra TaxID=246602 RepID=UPI0012B51335|nr:hypothetical protein [Pseudoduganella violaceinigra]